MITEIKAWYSENNRGFHVHFSAEEEVQIDNIGTKLLYCLTSAVEADKRWKFRPFIVEGTAGWVAKRI